MPAVYGGLFVLMSAGLLAIFNGMFATQVPGELPAAQASYASLLKVSAIALGLITVVSLTLAWLIAGRALQPLRAMTETTRRISAESLHERLAVAGPRDELTGLAGTINDLLERLEGSFAAQRRFAANAAHELRTPLATIRASLDNAIVHNEAGGWIGVSTESCLAGTCLVVDNGGGVLDPGLARELAQPFRRLGADRTRSDRGAGLGLSIVAAIAAAHQGTLELLPRPGAACGSASISRRHESPGSRGRAAARRGTGRGAA